MVTLVQDPHTSSDKGHGEGCSHGTENTTGSQRGYDGYVEPDTKIPPKAKSILNEVSVNDVAIPESEILAEAQQHPANSPGEALLHAARALAVRELLLQEALALEIEVEPIVGADGTVETVEDALIRQLMDQEVSAPVSDPEIRLRFYELHKHRFKSEAIFEARHILITQKDGEAPEISMKLAQSLIDDLLTHPKNFARLAKEYSACSSKNEGGNLGQLTIGSTVPEFEAVLEKMEPGQIWPKPVQSQFGHHIIHLVHKIPGEVLPFEYVEEKIGAWLEASSWSKGVSQYINILAGKSKIVGIDLNTSNSPLVQ